MKFIPFQLLFFFDNKTWRKNFTSLAQFLCFILFAVSLYSVLFHFIMLYEGREYSWLTGLYWTLTVMSTLGFGDITFTTDLGKAFTIVVLLSGIILLLVMCSIVEMLGVLAVNLLHLPGRRPADPH